MDRSTRSLTAHLARAAGTRAVEPVEVVADLTDIAAPAELGDDADNSRCAASVISGQRCRRPAAEGQDLCPGHIAMGTKVPSRR
jgi:hypothetical protein